MKTRTVILLESNQAVLEQLKTAFDESKDFTVLHAGDDGDEGIKEILNMKPDLVIVGMFLKGTDGSGVIRAVKKTWAEAKIVATGISNDTIIENVSQLSAISEEVSASAEEVEGRSQDNQQQAQMAKEVLNQVQNLVKEFSKYQNEV